jgi:hypothetical protein
VLASTDVLPLILNHIKEILKLQDASGWKKSFSAVILTNKAFFESGIAILWYTMDSLTPCLGLLPCITRPSSPRTAALGLVSTDMFRGIFGSGITQQPRVPSL